ncbi:MAG: PqqD family protein [Candidatus Promineifilaceae bacterium]
MGRYEKSPDAAYSELRGGAVALNLKTGQYYALNEVGARVWALLHEADSLEDVTAAIVAEYDVDAQQAAQDLHRLLHDLLDSGLICET